VIRCLEALRFRCLRNLRRQIRPFQILVGPNASGKSTFLDAIRFLGQLVSDGLELAVRERSENLQDLFWNRAGQSFELAIDLEIPEDRRRLLPGGGYRRCRYEVSIGIDPETQENSILAERVLLRHADDVAPVQRQLFPALEEAPDTILTQSRPKRAKTVVNKVRSGNDNFYDETGKGWDHAFKLGPRRSALANLPEDETKFPVATWLKAVLTQGVDTITLNCIAMRKPSPPGAGRGFRPDGSNVPWVIEDFRKTNPDGFHRWIAHVRTALPDLRTIETIERPEDKHRYLRIVYQGGLTVPSWVVSDGTLRLLALTLLAYVGGPGKIYLIEEPENGIHPQAVETVYQSLSSAYDCQIICASHSPVMLSLANPEDILCFAKTPEGATDVVRGDEHPNLRDWKRGTDLGTLFATGVLG